MKIRILLTSLAVLLVTLTTISFVHAVPATNFTLDKTSYNPGDSGKATVSFFNDQGVLIQITSVDISFNYYYSDGRVYAQDFISPALSMNVSAAATSQPITIQFNLPSGLAAGYFNPQIRVTYNDLNGGVFNGPNQDNTRASSPLLVSSSTSTQTVMYLFVAATVLFAVLASFFAIRYYAAKTPANRSQTN
jgi:hypothetical protein